MTDQQQPNEPQLDFHSLPLFAQQEPNTKASEQKSGAAQHLAARISGRPRNQTPTAPVGEPVNAGPAAPLTADPASVPTYPTDAGNLTRRRARNIESLDWGLVNGFRNQVSDRLAQTIADDESLDGEARLEVGRSLIVQVLRDHIDSLVRSGLEPWDESLLNRMQKAIYDSLFRLGRLQELVDDVEVENVMIFGHDKVWVDYGGGRFEERLPVADSDQQLIEDIQFLASRDGERGRPWSAAEWQLSLSLPGGERLQASHPPITPRPTVVIRRHPPITWTLDDLIERGTLTLPAAELLKAAVKARKSIIVVGQQGAGKTTFTRALCHVIPPLEHIVTIESERELFLHKSDLHPLCTSFEARPGQGEPNPDGSRPGEVNVEQLIPASLRHNTQRIIVGEVRGPEMIAMLQAMQSGAGSISTIHANSPADAVERMAVLLSQRGAPSEFGYKLIAQHIDFVVQLSNHLQGDRTEKRFVTEVSELIPGEGARPVAQSIFKAKRGDDEAQVVGLPQNDTLEELELVGFDTEKWLRPSLGRAAS
ncbi:CpaF family protein [Rathayibacter rathayi]|uniref:CpaF family protein n=1 Tax=Rathayibacter rathayi TaxID=33887 RepID=UPI000CE8874B|nr:ATPase, T2SS/T4P/T4SS family [Rathayibacter rathayi]PPG77494.1 CpaF family protein [Rathayibacter rathayi]PPG94330.1 CpaF family protein [Rathayibacter rathayi]PPI65262.1 CpaF family protein [Rathayibacter rathayi]